MNEDYLWDKKGHDIEIENLENLLSQFRYQETPAPAIIPEKVFTVEKSAKRRTFSFSFAFAFASCAAFVLILLGVWFQISNKNVENINDLSKSITPEIKIVLPEKSAEHVAPIEITKISQTAEKPTFIKTKNPTLEKKLVPQKTIFIEKTNKVPKVETVKLTAEEQYAYDQLMLALSITSSKLKLVKDKVISVETQNLILKKDDNTRRN